MILYDPGEGKIQMFDYSKNDSVLNRLENNGANNWKPPIVNN